MPIPRDKQEGRLVAEFEKCHRERATAENTILYPHSSRIFNDQKKMLAHREVARVNYDNALVELKAYRETLATKI
jgi:hypothetical protein